MPFEDIDKKIREAADHHHPAYDNAAWNKMEAKLDKHLPLKKERKRLGLFLLLLLLVAGGAGYILLNPSGKKNSTAINETPAAQQKTDRPIQRTPAFIPEREITSPASSNPAATEKQILQTSLFENNTVTKTSPVRKNQLLNRKKKQKTPDAALQPGLSGNVSINQPSEISKQNNPFPSSSSAATQSINEPVVSKKEPATIPAASSLTESKEKSEEIAAEEKNNSEKNAGPVVLSKKKEKTKKGNGLFFTLSAGPDLGIVKMENTGKVKTSTGIGVGYTFKKRFSLQTGFYTSRKIYTAGPKDYNPPGWWWIFYPNLEKVDGDCKVYEIPLLATWNFTNNKKGNWFGTAGLSSYLMKKEQYQYYYKTNAGVPTTRKWTFTNENKHYFSVITLAGGYEKTISKNFSVSVSPYLKMPWQGVGFGKIKLNSAGIMFNANFRPFPKK